MTKSGQPSVVCMYHEEIMETEENVPKDEEK
jgi:hypothetical protein